MKNKLLVTIIGLLHIVNIQTMNYQYMPYNNLQSAINENNLSLVHNFLQNGANPNEQDEIGDTALHIAAKLEDINPEIIKALFNAGADERIKNNNHTDALETAFDENPDIYDNLFVTVPEPEERLFSFAKNNSHALKNLLSSGINSNIRNSEGYTPLHYAANAGNLEATQLLIYAGANPLATGWIEPCSLGT